MFMLPQRQSLGELLGQAIGNVADQWAENRSTRKALEGLGFNDQEARAYAKLGPQATQQAIQARQQEQAREKSASITQSLLNKGIGGQQPSMQPYQQPSIQPASTGVPKRTLPHEQQAEAIQQATGIAQNPAYRKLQEQQQQAQALQQQQLARSNGPQANQLTGEQQAILQSQAPQKEPSSKERLEDVQRRRRALVAAPISDSDKKNVHQILEDEESAIREEIKEANREKRENKKEDRKDKREADKETLETYTKTVDSYRSAKDSNATLSRMEKLIGSGLPHPITQSAIKFLKDGVKLGKFGSILSLDVSSFLGGNAEEFNKLSNGFLRHGKEIFGSRMTDFDVDTFLQMVPSLLQTNEGKQRIINNMRALNDAAELRYNAMKEIIKENGNKRPQHLDMLIEERVGDKLDALYSKFVEGYGPQSSPGTNTILGDVARGVYRAIVPH